jgi:hypothetical protein
MYFVMTEHVDLYIEAVPMYKMDYFTTVCTTGNPASIQFVVMYMLKE